MGSRPQSGVVRLRRRKTVQRESRGFGVERLFGAGGDGLQRGDEAGEVPGGQGIAEAIVGASLERDPELWTAFATAALESLDDPRDAKLRAGQDAFAMLLDALGAPEVTYRGVRVPIVVDPSLDGLGCVAEAGRSRVDGRLAERLDAVKDALIHERRRAKEAP